MDGTDRQTYLPDGEQGDLRPLRDLIADVAGSEASTLTLAASGGSSAVVVPPQVRRILEQVVRALDDGLAVSVTPLSRTVTTQQAADLLGISRPTLVRILDDGLIPYDRAGTHRRLMLRDVLAYREARRQRQLAAIEATSVPLDDEDDLDDALALLREVRARRGTDRRVARDVGGA